MLQQGAMRWCPVQLQMTWDTAIATALRSHQPGQEKQRNPHGIIYCVVPANTACFRDYLVNAADSELRCAAQLPKGMVQRGLSAGTQGRGQGVGAALCCRASGTQPLALAAPTGQSCSRHSQSNRYRSVCSEERCSSTKKGKLSFDSK